MAIIVQLRAGIKPPPRSLKHAALVRKESSAEKMGGCRCVGYFQCSFHHFLWCPQPTHRLQPLQPFWEGREIPSCEQDFLSGGRNLESFLVRRRDSPLGEWCQFWGLSFHHEQRVQVWLRADFMSYYFRKDSIFF